jgi:hypothetical protein
MKKRSVMMKREVTWLTEQEVQMGNQEGRSEIGV